MLTSRTYESSKDPNPELLVIGSIFLAIGRFTVPYYAAAYLNAYAALAHIWIGILITLGCVNSKKLLPWLLVIALSCVEVFAFLDK